MLDEYIIVEIIPTKSKRELGGDIIQVSCLKINNLLLEDSLYLRQKLDYINIPDLVKMLDYGHDYFKTTKYVNEVEKKFKKFIGNTPLLIMDNDYTRDYLSDYPNKKVSIFDMLGFEEHSNVFQEIRDVYHIEDTPDLVTILYEALIAKYNDGVIGKRKK